MYRHYGKGVLNRQGAHPIIPVKRARFLQFLRGTVCFAVLIGVTSPLFPQEGGGSAWDKAVEALRYDRLDEAVALLGEVVRTDPTRIEAVNLLALAYEQLGDGAEAERLLRGALDRGGLSARNLGQVALSLGALFSRQSRNDEAVEMYTSAIEYDGTTAGAYLNRANTYVETGSYQAAIDDYRRYLVFRPADSQRGQIERMIALLTTSITEQARAAQEAEQRKAAAQEAQRVAREQAEQAAEQRRQQAEVARQQMLNSVLQSMSSANEETENFEVEAEDLQRFTEEIDIVD